MTVDARLTKLEKEIQRLNTLVLGARRSAGGAAAHNILSLTHSDSLPAALVRGDILAVDASPDLARLAIGAAGTFVRSDGVDPSWSTILVADLPANIIDTGLQATNLAAGTTGQRPFGTVGDIRYNSTLIVFEAYTGSWQSILLSGDIGIADNDILSVDGVPVVNDYAKFTANGLLGRSYDEVLSDLSGEALAAFSWNSQNLTSVGTIGCGDISSTGVVLSISTLPSFRLKETDMGPDLKYMDMFQSGGSFEMRFVNDAYTLAEAFLTVGRTGGGTPYAVADVKIPNGYFWVIDMKSGATQAAAGASAGELWKTNGHASLPDNVIIHGV